MKMEGTALIHRPIDDVVDFMMDAHHDPVWDLQRAGGWLRFLSADRTEDGKRDDVFDIYEYAGPERLTRLMRHTRFPHIEITSTWAFVAVPDGTRLYVTMEVAPRGILNVLAPLIYLDMTKRAAWVLARLTRVLERRELSSTVGPGDS
jgi:hypothetical protein